MFKRINGSKFRPRQWVSRRFRTANDYHPHRLAAGQHIDTEQLPGSIPKQPKRAERVFESRPPALTTITLSVGDDSQSTIVALFLFSDRIEKERPDVSLAGASRRAFRTPSILQAKNSLHPNEDGNRFFSNLTRRPCKVADGGRAVNLAGPERNEWFAKRYRTDAGSARVCPEGLSGRRNEIAQDWLLSAYWRNLAHTITPGSGYILISQNSAKSRKLDTRMLSIRQNTKFCWICGRDVSLEQSVTDEHGLSVHRTCHETRMRLKWAAVKTDVSRPPEQNAA